MAEPELIEAYLISMRVRRDAQKVTVSDQVGGHTPERQTRCLARLL